MEILTQLINTLRDNCGSKGEDNAVGVTKCGKSLKILAIGSTFTPVLRQYACGQS